MPLISSVHLYETLRRDLRGGDGGRRGRRRLFRRSRGRPREAGHGGGEGLGSARRPAAASCGGGGALRPGEGLGLPNPDLAAVLVSNLCFAHNTPSLWKLLDQAMASRLLSPLHTLALLTPRVIPNRRAQPEAYRLYLELLNRYMLSSSMLEAGPCRDKITKSIDEALQLSQTYGVDQMDIGLAVVLFTLCVITSLIDCTLKDFGLPFVSRDGHVNFLSIEGQQTMDIDYKGSSNDKRNEHREQLRRTNSLLALEVVEKMAANRKTQVFLRLIHLNMYAVSSLIFAFSYKARPEKFNGLLQRLRFIEAHKSGSKSLVSANHIIDSLFANVQRAMNMEYQLNKRQLLGVLIDAAPELTKTLQIINEASWLETFLALWLSALRLYPTRPIPHLDARLCMLLAILPSSIAPLLKDENEMLETEGNKVPSRRQGLISSLQVLAQFSSLLSPPPSVINAANSAATKAAVFISNFKTGSGNLGMVGRTDSSPKAVGNMLHLIDSPWSTFMQGAPLTVSLKNALMATPASSVAELEKLYDIALHGSDEEKSAASRILCGASFVRGWHIQEHVVRIVVKLLSPPLSSDSSVPGSGSHFVGHMPMLNALLFGVSSADTVHILSLYGMVPEVAVALMPLCETFGSLPPPSNHRSTTFDEPSVYSVFSCAFLFLLRLWKFYKPPQEHCMAGRGGSVRMELTLDYLLLMHNSRVALQKGPSQPVYIDSFPKLRAWYFQIKLA
uniref:Mediator of RNA polymerase II transcription subunit 33A n=1 Tax=Ananas comosus var. bracteatus TaxID=296719 RepID=A0A6V7QSZ3_ANACO